MNNIEKKEKYSNLMSRLKRATDNEYYYEAIFIEYAILEDRTESLLKHAGKKFQENNGNPFKISKKLNKQLNIDVSFFRFIFGSLYLYYLIFILHFCY